jgi:hypothetical protein
MLRLEESMQMSRLNMPVGRQLIQGSRIRRHAKTQQPRLVPHLDRFNKRARPTQINGVAASSIATKYCTSCDPTTSTYEATLRQFVPAQLRRAAIARYPARSHSITPGIAASHTNGRAHQISRAKATHASAPPYGRPSPSNTRISRINSVFDKPSSTPTRSSCNGATAIPRRCKIGANHRAIRVQHLHSASKNNHARACRPFPSVNSEASEIML